MIFRQDPAKNRHSKWPPNLFLWPFDIEKGENVKMWCIFFNSPGMENTNILTCRWTKSDELDLWLIFFFNRMFRMIITMPYRILKMVLKASMKVVWFFRSIDSILTFLGVSNSPWKIHSIFSHVCQNSGLCN